MTSKFSNKCTKYWRSEKFTEDEQLSVNICQQTVHVLLQNIIHVSIYE